MKKCVFFDRDGIVNTSPGEGYVERWEDFHLQPGFARAARVALAHGYVVVVVSNQRGVARGLMTQATLEDIHVRMRAALQAEGVELLGVYCCMHERDTCTCRKPQPGMLLAASREHGLNLEASWMVGDRESDVEAGRRAGCRTLLVSREPGKTRATEVVEDIEALATALERLLDNNR